MSSNYIPLGVVSSYNPSSNVWECLFFHSLINTTCYQTFGFLTIWQVKMTVLTCIPFFIYLKPIYISFLMNYLFISFIHFCCFCAYLLKPLYFRNIRSSSTINFKYLYQFGIRLLILLLNFWFLILWFLLFCRAEVLIMWFNLSVF